MNLSFRTPGNAESGIRTARLAARARSLRGSRVCAILALAGALATPSLASHVPTPQPQANQAGAASRSAADAPLAIEQFAAKSVERVALLDLRAQPDASQAQYALTADLLGIAQTLDPADVNIVRRRIEAAWNAGDSDLTRELSRRLVQLDPANTVAQLAVISSQINLLQTAPERLAAMARIVAATSIDPSVRSRVALDAALLSREQGDDAGFDANLRTSLKLDPSNKAAANLAATLYAGNDPEKRFELLSNLLLADPLDVAVLDAMTQSLAFSGAFEQAQRFDRLVTKLQSAIPEGRTIQGFLQSSVLRWQADGAAPVLEDLQKQLAILRDDARKRLEAAEESRTGLEREVPNLPKPEEVTLAPEADQLRLLAADALGKSDIIASVIADMGVFNQRRAAIMTDASRRAKTITDEMAAEFVANDLLTLATARAFANIEVDQASEARASLSETSPVSPDRLVLLDALLAWRKGDAATARRLLATLPDTNTPKLAALAEIERTADNRERAATLYLDAARQAPLSPLGAWARSRHRELTGKDVPLTPAAERLTALARQVPGWLERAVGEPRSYMTLAARLVDTSLHATRPARVRLSLRNISPIALAVGAQAPLSSSVLVTPYGDSRAVTLQGLVPEVCQIENRLKLAPNEVMEIDIEPDAGLSGWSIGAACDTTVRLRYRVLQGFTADSGVIEPGPQSLSTESQSLVRPPLVETRLTTPQLAARLRERVSELSSLILAVRARLLKPGEEPLDDLVKALVERLNNATFSEGAALITGLPPSGVVAAMEPFDRAALALDDPSLRSLALIARAKGDDPLIDAAAASDHAVLSRVGRALADRRATDGVFLGVNWISPPSSSPLVP